MATVDDRVVQMNFDNRSFETAVATTLGTLQKLKNALNFGDSSKSLDGLDQAASKFSMAGMGNQVEGVSKKFLALGTVGITALATITNKVVDAGIAMAKSLTLDPIKEGFQSYETQINAVQTILSNTASEGTKLPQVTAALKELNTYANLTVYNFADMAKNIGTFTAAGVDLKTSVSSIKGIANLAALSGANTEQASNAMYQLSQAIAAGRVKLQDWNSVVNAGLGGKVFQTALTRTAANNGVAIDQIIKQTGSFRQSLQTGWLTSDILTKTLAQFTGDLSLAQIKAMGYTDAEAKSIFDQGQIAVNAATKIKTLSQLTQALKEEVATAYGAVFKTIFGNITDATALFSKIHTAAENGLTNPIYALNNLLAATVALGGRAKIIDGFTTALHAVGSVFHAVDESFREFFPAKTAKDLYSLTVAFDNFAHKLTPSEATLSKISDTFAGVFAVMHIGETIIGDVFRLFERLFGSFSGAGSGILTVSAGLGNFLVGVDAAVTGGTKLTNFFTKLGDVLTVPIKFLRDAAASVKDLFSGLDTKAVDGVSGALGKMGARLTPIGKDLSIVHDKLTSFFHTLGVDVQPALQGIAKLFGQLGTNIAQALSSGNFTGVLRVIQTGLLGGILLAVKKFFASGETLLGRGFIGNIRETFEGLTGSIKAMQTQIEAKTIKTIAEAIALLTVSVIALSFVNAKNLSTSLKAMAVGFGELLYSFKLLVGISGAAGIIKMPVVAASLILLSTGILVLTAAVAVLAAIGWDSLVRGLAGVGVLLASVSAAAFVLSKNEAGMISAGIGITAMAVGIDLLAVAVKLFSSMSWEQLAKGLTGVAGLLVAVAAGMALMPPGLIFTAAGVLEIAVAMQGLYLAVKEFSSLNFQQLATGIGGIAVTLIAIGVAMRVMPRGIVLQAAGLVLIGAALLIIQKALSEFAGMSWSEIGKGLAVMASSLAILAAAMYLMEGSIAGAAALVIVVGALAVLAPVLKTLGGMSWEQIGKGIGTLAAAFAVLGVAALAMSEVTPVLIGLGIAISLIGVGVLAAGAGVSLLAAGLGVLAASGSAGISVLLAAVDKFIADIPGIATAFAQGLINVLKIIGTNGPAIVKAFGTILASIVTVIIANAPGVANAIGVVLQALLNFLLNNAPSVIAAGVQLIEDLLTGIQNNIGQIVDQASAVIVGFLNALALHIDDIVAAGLNVLVQFLNGIASGTGQVVDAVGNIIITFTNAVSNKLGDIITAGTNMIVSFINGIGNNVDKIVTAGTNVIIKFIEGLGANASKLVDAAGKTIVDFLNALDDSIKKYEPQIMSAAANIGIDIINGIVQGIGSLPGKVFGAIKDDVGGALDDAKNFLHINSPSKLFAKEIGSPISEGIAYGITQNNGFISDALKQTASKAINTMSDSLSKIPNAINSMTNLSPTLTPVLDLTQVTKDATKLNGLISVAPITTDVAFKAATSISVSQQQQAADAAKTDTDATPAAGPTIEYKQYNTSPKALSTLDIYRQTKNQLGQAKIALGLGPYNIP